MKIKAILFYVPIVVLTFSIFGGNATYAQERVNFTAGFGIPELINVGVRYQLDEHSQLSLSAGTDLLMFSLSGDIFYHFAGSTPLSWRRPWYARAGLSYWQSDNEFATETWLWFNPRVGRDFNISGRWGISVDAGVALRLQNEEVTKKSGTNPSNINIDYPVLPGLGVAVFYRL